MLIKKQIPKRGSFTGVVSQKDILPINSGHKLVRGQIVRTVMGRGKVVSLDNVGVTALIRLENYGTLTRVDASGETGNHLHPYLMY